MHGTPRAKIGGDLKIIGKGELRVVKDVEAIVGTIELTDNGWRGFRFPDGSVVKWKPQRSRPAVVRYEKVMKAWSARSIWGEPDEDKEAR